ncbi:MAG: uroporphyrinogen decarboxylase family protein [Propionibacteriaceae bacterium]|nr:uroporphyrinogen decarboxylase family protein [Propionibacteriaceae bacterium]
MGKTLAFQQAYDWDWVKLNPRNSYYAESWGNVYDYDQYVGPHPKQIFTLVNQPSEIERVTSDVDWEFYDSQNQVLSEVVAALPETPVVQTVFSPFTVLTTIAGQPRQARSPLHGSNSTATVAALIAERPRGLANALENITLVLEKYLGQIAATGADAIFYAVTGTAHHEILSQEEFERYSTPYDQALISAAKAHGLGVIFHTCGEVAYPERFEKWQGIDALSWDHFSPANALLDAPFAPVPLGGIDQRAVKNGDVETVARQAAETLLAFADKPLLLGPACGINPIVGDPALLALRGAVETQT